MSYLVCRGSNGVTSYSGSKYENLSSVGTRHLCLRTATGASGVVKYGLSTDPAVTNQPGLKIRVSSNAVAGIAYNYSVSASGRQTLTSSTTNITNSSSATSTYTASRSSGYTNTSSMYTMSSSSYSSASLSRYTCSESTLGTVMVNKYTVLLSTMSNYAGSSSRAANRTSITKSSFSSYSLTRTTYQGRFSKSAIGSNTSSSGIAQANITKTVSNYITSTAPQNVATVSGTGTGTLGAHYSSWVETTRRFAVRTGNIYSYQWNSATTSTSTFNYTATRSTLSSKGKATISRTYKILATAVMNSKTGIWTFSYPTYASYTTTTSIYNGYTFASNVTSAASTISGTYATARGQLTATNSYTTGAVPAATATNATFSSASVSGTYGVTTPISGGGMVASSSYTTTGLNFVTSSRTASALSSAYTITSRNSYYTNLSSSITYSASVVESSIIGSRSYTSGAAIAAGSNSTYRTRTAYGSYATTKGMTKSTSYTSSAYAPGHATNVTYSSSYSSTYKTSAYTRTSGYTTTLTLSTQSKSSLVTNTYTTSQADSYITNNVNI